jgi:hypothetical protein
MHRLIVFVLTAVGLTLAISACSSGTASTTTVQEATTTTTVQEATTITPDHVVMTTTFDGEECTYDGPGELSQGDVRLINHNESSEPIWVWFGRLDEGRTFQQVIDWVDATPTAGSPAWTRQAFFREIPGGESWEGVRYLGSGLIVVVCGFAVDDHAYYGSGITVTE